jgi:hypothetical protein
MLLSVFYYTYVAVLDISWYFLVVKLINNTLF